MKWFVVYVFNDSKDPEDYETELCDDVELINLISNKFVKILRIVRCNEG